MSNPATSSNLFMFLADCITGNSETHIRNRIVEAAERRETKAEMSMALVKDDFDRKVEDIKVSTKMLVNLTYFKQNGKYYSEGTYETTLTVLHEIWNEVKNKRDSGNLPGVAGKEWTISVDVPNHPNNHPHLIL